MKKAMLLLLAATLTLSACTEKNSASKPTAKDSIQKSTTDSIKYNPATPAAQNSDDPNRFSQ